MRKRPKIPDFAHRLRQHREAMELTQETIAHRASVTAKFLSQIENGHSNPSIGVAQRIVELGLRVPMATFYGGGDADDQPDEVQKIGALLADQPASVRRLALKVVRALAGE